MLRGLEPNAVFASARTGEGIAEVLAAIGRMLPDPAVEIDLLVPYDRGDVVSTLHETGRVLSTEYVEDGTRIRALASPEQAAQLAGFAAVARLTRRDAAVDRTVLGCRRSRHFVPSRRS